MRRILESILLFALMGCSEDNGAGAGSGGTGGATDSGSGGSSGLDGSAEGSAGSNPCTAVTGTYMITGTRQQPAGSCPNTLVHPGENAVISGDLSNYKLEMTGFPNKPYVSKCTVNITACTISATCIEIFESASWTNNIQWEVSATGLTGTEAWTGYDGTPGCTANWDVIGVRQ